MLSFYQNIKANRLAGIFLLVVMGLISSCNNGGGGGSGGNNPGVPPLTKLQKERLDTTSQNVAQVTDWQSQKSAMNLNDSLSNTAEFNTNPGNLNKKKLQEEVSGACEFEMIQPEQPRHDGRESSMPAQKIGMSIKGDKCPIRFSFLTTTEYNQTPNSMTFKATLGMNYSAASEIAKKMDVQSISMNMATEVIGQENGASGQMSGDGQIISTSQGVIKLKISGSMVGNSSGMAQTTVFSLNYEDGTVVELKEVATQANENAPKLRKCYINNVEVDQKEFDQYQKDFGFNKGNQNNQNNQIKEF